MTLNHRKKNSRHRGSWTCTHGEKKKHRGAGSRGGRGNAGSGKRGDAKKPRYWKIKDFSGKHGFTNATSKSLNTISISQLNTSIAQLVAAGNAIKDGNSYKVNLQNLSIDKVLGTGTPLFAYHLVVGQASSGAIKKIEEKAGSVTIVVKSKEQAPSSKPQEVKNT